MYGQKDYTLESLVIFGKSFNRTSIKGDVEFTVEIDLVIQKKSLPFILTINYKFYSQINSHEN